MAVALALHCAHGQTAPESTSSPQQREPQRQQTPPAADLEQLRAQVDALTKTVGSLQHQLDEQKSLWSGFHTSAAEAINPTRAASDGKATTESSSDLEQLRNDVDELKTAQRQVKSGLFNPDISAAGDFITSYSRKANNWNFTMRNVELMVQSNIDEYARAYIVANAGMELVPTERNDIFTDTSLNIEEAAVVTTSLPWGLQVKAGQFFADFTRLGKVHDHDLPFVDRPLSLDSTIGGETKARGFELNWLVPIPHYLRLTGGLVDNIGATLPVTSNLLNFDRSVVGSVFNDRNRPFDALMEYARAATLFDLGHGAVLHLGADYAFRSQKTRRQIASGDLKLEWQPDPAKYDLFEAGGEALWTKQSGEIIEDARFNRITGDASASGGYLYAQYRFGKLWQPGVRVDYTHSNSFQLLDTNNDGDADTLCRYKNNIWTYSAYLTLYLSEFNRLRLQLNYLNGSEEIVPGKGHNDLQAFFQWTFIMGAHKHDFSP